MTDAEVDLGHVRRMWDDDGASAHLGMEATVVEVDHAVVRMTVGEHMVNGHDIAHGGYLFTLADSAFALGLQLPRRPHRGRRERTSPSSPPPVSATCSSPRRGSGSTTAAAGSPTSP